MTTAEADKKTLAAAVVTDTTAHTDAVNKVTAETDKTSAADKTANDSAEKTAAVKLAKAKDAVTANAAKIAVLTTRKAYGAPILANTY